MTSITETVRSTAQGMAKAESADKKSTETVDAVSQERVGGSQNLSQHLQRCNYLRKLQTPLKLLSSMLQR